MVQVTTKSLPSSATAATRHTGTSSIMSIGGRLKQKRSFVFAVLMLVLMVISSTRQKSAEIKESTSTSGITGSSPAAVTGMTTKVNTGKDKAQSKALKKRVQKQLAQNQGYRLCQLKTPILPNEPRFQAPILNNIPPDVSPLLIRFQCAGKPYDKFGSRLQDFLQLKKQEQEVQQREQKHKQTIPLWGQRARPFPPHLDQETSSKNQPKKLNILFFGSTHLRQVITALLCQYSEQVVKVERIYGHSKHSVSSMSLHATLQNNIHLYVIISPPFIYSPQWKILMQRHVLKMSLERMDYIVLGRFHGYTPAQGHALLEFLLDNEGQREADKHLVAAEPPTFLDLVNVYNGPIVYVSLFAPYANATLTHVQQSIEALWQGREPPEEPPMFNKKKKKKPKNDLEEEDDDEDDPQHAIQFQVEAKDLKIESNPISESAQSMFQYKPPPPIITRNTKPKKKGLLGTLLGGGRRLRNRYIQAQIHEQQQGQRRLEEDDEAEEDALDESAADESAADAETAEGAEDEDTDDAGNEKEPQEEEEEENEKVQEETDNEVVVDDNNEGYGDKNDNTEYDNTEMDEVEPANEDIVNKETAPDEEEFDDHDIPVEQAIGLRDASEDDEEQVEPPTDRLNQKKSRKPITQRRTNLVAIDARAYVEPLGECASDQMKHVGTCITDPAHAHFSKGHRCFGRYGGHSDLVAWDITEALYKLYNRQQQARSNSLLSSIMEKAIDTP